MVKFLKGIFFLNKVYVYLCMNFLGRVVEYHASCEMGGLSPVSELWVGQPHAPVGVLRGRNDVSLIFLNQIFRLSEDSVSK